MWRDKPSGPGLYWAYMHETDATVPVSITQHPQLGLQLEEFGKVGSVSPDSGQWREAKWDGPIFQPPITRHARPVPELVRSSGLANMKGREIAAAYGLNKEKPPVRLHERLQIWNGGEAAASFLAKDDQRLPGMKHNATVYIYACARSRADLARMIAEYQGVGKIYGGLDARLRTHWSEGLWGTHMEGITRERGLWVQYDHTEKPVRVWPKEK